VPHAALHDVPGAGELLAIARAEGVLAANRRLLRSMQAVEDSLDRESVLVRYLLPSVQAATTRVLRAGNEQVILGRGDWLFFADDVEFVTGPPFLDRAVLHRRVIAGDERTAAPQPDPMVAIETLAAQLRDRGIRLVLLPVPVKPMLLPERLTRRGAGAPLPIENRSWPDFVARIEALGIELVDPAPALVAAHERDGAEIFLRGDTHWTPAAMAAVAELLAAAVRPRLDPGAPEVAWTRREAAVDGAGDLVRLLNLPRGQTLYAPQPVRVQRVIGPDGSLWTSDPRAEVLLLGDSFSNVFADAELGWGTGAGLAEQLSFYLRRPVERLADNGGGANGALERLTRDLAHGIDRLDGKRVVIYEFATRYLTSGDWKEPELR
jgi:alginate O-acetyltransferase complex protein AlgJ